MQPIQPGCLSLMEKGVAKTRLDLSKFFHLCHVRVLSARSCREDDRCILDINSLLCWGYCTVSHFLSFAWNHGVSWWNTLTVWDSNSTAAVHHSTKSLESILYVQKMVVVAPMCAARSTLVKREDAWCYVVGLGYHDTPGQVEGVPISCTGENETKTKLVLGEMR